MKEKLNSIAIRSAYRFLSATRLEGSPAMERLRRLLKRSFVNSLSGNQGLILSEVDGFRMLVPPEFMGYYVLKRYSRFMMELFEESLKPGQTVIDVGAHIGYYTLLAATRVGKTGKVCAFEPAPGNFELLQKNIALNDLSNVTTFQKAAGAESGKRTLHFGETSDCNSLYEVEKAKSGSACSVDCATIDETIGPATASIIKVDVEGAEIEVLMGMKKTLESSREDLKLFIEYFPEGIRKSGQEPEQLFEILRLCGFNEIQLINENSNRLEPFKNVREIPFNKTAEFINLYCVR